MTTFQALATTKTPPHLTCEQQRTPMAQAFADAVRYDRQAAAMTVSIPWREFGGSDRSLSLPAARRTVSFNSLAGVRGFGHISCMMYLTIFDVRFNSLAGVRGFGPCLVFPDRRRKRKVSIPWREFGGSDGGGGS
ncbi:MAG: hypothetical protein KDI03_13490, partial [Anaerolineae bacterium]|nr:hypothetical protein [Anaerolineae bacterium]